MRVESNTEIAGLPVLEVRRFLRETVHDYGWDRHTLKAALKLSDRRCAAVLRGLSEEGYIEASPSFRDAWRNTTKGNALASASAAKSLCRQTADQKLREFLDRVHFVNSSGCDFLYWVEEVALFGSMLKQQQSVNDIDVCVRMERKLKGDAYSKAADLRRRMARQQGRTFRNILDEAYWPEREVRLFLKNRSRAISLVEWDVEWLAVTPHKIIYRRLASAQPPKKTR
jgi:predicted nucleotidyltransferase